MKTPDYHNPQGVPESALKPGERFLLREEVGSEQVDRKCYRWKPSFNDWCYRPALGINSNITYKTTLILPPEYREPDYSDTEYRKGVEQAFRDGKRVQSRTPRGWVNIHSPCWTWAIDPYRIHPEDIEMEIDWKTPEKQAEVRKMWAENPAMEREQMPKNKTLGWGPCITKGSWSGELYYYRPAQKPREKTQQEIAKEAFAKLKSETQTQGWDISTNEDFFIAGWNAREASRKGVA